MKKLLATLVLGISVLALPAASLAAEFRVPEKGKSSVQIGESEQLRNLYAAGTSVDVISRIFSDLAVAGNSINLSGSVESDLFAAGNNVNVSGDVGGSARVAGSTINIASKIGEDLLAAGSSLSISSSGRVGADALIAGADITINGPVFGDLKIAGGTVTINSSIGGDVVIYGQNIALGDNARIDGNLRYESDKEATISNSAVINGTVDFKKSDKSPVANINNAGRVFGVFGLFTLYGLISLVSTILLLLVLVYLLPKTSYILVKNSLASFWSKLGWGFLTFIVAPTVLIVLAVTFVGLKLSAAIFLLYGAMIVVSYTAATVVIGSQIVRWFEKKDYRVDWLAVLVGVAATLILGMIPVLGSLIILAVVLAVLGQLTIYLGAFLKRERK